MPEFVTVHRTDLDTAVFSTFELDIADPRFEQLEGAIDESPIGARIVAAFYDSENEYMIVWLHGDLDGRLPIFLF